MDFGERLEGLEEMVSRGSWSWAVVEDGCVLLWWKTVSFEGSSRCGKVKCFVPLFLARDGDSGSVRSGSCEEIRSYEGISSYGLPFLLSFPLSSLSLFFFSVVKFSVLHLRLCIAILLRWSGFIGLQSGFFFLLLL